MRTMAIRLDDDLAATLALYAELRQTSIISVVRDAITEYLERQAADGELAAQAQAALDAIDREAEAKRAALGDLVGRASKAPAAKAPSRRRQRDEPEKDATTEPEAQSNPIGFAAARSRRER